MTNKIKILVADEDRFSTYNNISKELNQKLITDPELVKCVEDGYNKNDFILIIERKYPIINLQDINVPDNLSVIEVDKGRGFIIEAYRYYGTETMTYIDEDPNYYCL